MLNPQQTITLYQEMLDISTQMLDAATHGDWEKMSALQEHCSINIDRLKRQGPPIALSGVDREYKVAMIHQILANDKAIRDITMPWMKELSKLIHRTDTELKLAHSYQRLNNL